MKRTARSINTPTTLHADMSTTGRQNRTCSHPQCQTSLRKDNNSGYCTAHRDPNANRYSRSSSNVSANTDENDEPTTGVLDVDPINAVPNVPLFPPPKESTKSVLRSYDRAIISACGENGSTVERQQQTTKFIDALRLEPLAVIDSNGAEENVLGRASVIASLYEKQKRGVPLTLEPPAKRMKMEPTISHSMPIDLELIIRNSHVSTSLAKNQ